MTKRQIIKWLESQSEKALAEIETQSEKALNTYYAERNERIGLEDTATSIAALMQQVYSLTESFKEKVKAEYPGVDTLCGYYGSISYKLANMSSQAEIRSCLLKEFEDGRTEIRKGIKARKNEMIKGITDNYRNVIANVSNMKNAKLAMELVLRRNRRGSGRMSRRGTLPALTSSKRCVNFVEFFVRVLCKTAR